MPLPVDTVVQALMCLGSWFCSPADYVESAPVVGWYFQYTTERYGCEGDCDYNAILNAQTLAGERLWPEVVDSYGVKGLAPCGGVVDCLGLLAPNVACIVERTDCDFTHIEPKVLKTFLLECRGDLACQRELMRPEECCQVVREINGKVSYWP
jgi:hypothetical protein